MKKEYTKPTTTISYIKLEGVICNSDAHPRTCNDDCKIWHICHDRDTKRNGFCIDKKYKY